MGDDHGKACAEETRRDQKRRRGGGRCGGKPPEPEKAGQRPLLVVGHGGKGFDAAAGGMEYPLTLLAVIVGLIFTGPGALRLGKQEVK